jgi:hypothetical protein
MYVAEYYLYGRMFYRSDYFCEMPVPAGAGTLSEIPERVKFFLTHFQQGNPAGKKI